MEVLVDFIRRFFVLSLILILFSYLLPKESYRRYLQFFIGIFMTVVILEPAAALLKGEQLSTLYEGLEEWEEYLAEMEYDVEHGKTIYELFYMGESEEQSEKQE